MTKAQDRAEAWVVLHKHLPEVVKFLRKAGVIPKEK